MLLLLLLLLLRWRSGAYCHGLLTEARASRKCACDFWRTLWCVAVVECKRCCEAFWLTESETLGDVDRALEPTPSVALDGFPGVLEALSSPDSLVELCSGVPRRFAFLC